MSWEQRGNQRYYYQKRRLNGRVVSVYLGRGPAAQSAANAVSRREAERRKFLQHKRRLEQQDAWIEQYCQQVELAIAAGLVAAGFHPHRGELRRTATPGRPRTEVDSASVETDRAPVARTQPLPDPTNPQSMSEAIGRLKYAVDDLGTVVEGVEIKNPRYLALLAKMRGTNPIPDPAPAPQNKPASTNNSDCTAGHTPTASRSKPAQLPPATRTPRPANRRRSGFEYQPSESPPPQLLAAVAMLKKFETEEAHGRSARPRYPAYLRPPRLRC